MLRSVRPVRLAKFPRTSHAALAPTRTLTVANPRTLAVPSPSPPSSAPLRLLSSSSIRTLATMASQQPQSGAQLIDGNATALCVPPRLSLVERGSFPAISPSSS